MSWHDESDPVCQTCGAPLGRWSPSSDFCNEVCQDTWYLDHTHEPSDHLWQSISWQLSNESDSTMNLPGRSLSNVIGVINYTGALTTPYLSYALHRTAPYITYSPIS